MSETDQAPETSEGQQAAPRLAVITQYVKDLSFENPKAPESLMHSEDTPDAKMSVNVDVQAKKKGDNLYTAELSISASAHRGDDPVFVVELVYGGLFQLDGIPPEGLEPVLLIECPRILFPFARRIIADCSRDGGYPPLLLEPIDFAGMYRQQMSQRRAEQADA